LASEGTERRKKEKRGVYIEKSKLHTLGGGAPKKGAVLKRKRGREIERWEVRSNCHVSRKPIKPK